MSTPRLSGREKLRRKRDRAKAARLSQRRSELKQLLPLDAGEMSELSKFVESFIAAHPDGHCMSRNCTCKLAARKGEEGYHNGLWSTLLQAPCPE